MNRWFRMYHEFATDPKVQMMSEADQRRFVMVLCLRCSNGDVTLHDTEVAFQLRITDEEYAGTKARFVAAGLIDDRNIPVAWDKRQFVSDSSAARVSKHRQKNKDKMKRYSNGGVAPPDTDTDTDTDKEKNKYSCPEVGESVLPSKLKAVLQIPLAGKGLFDITEEDITAWGETFPGLDIMQHVRIIRQWNLDNPKNRKTKGGIRKHITSWLAKEQNKARPTGNKKHNGDGTWL